MTGRSWEGLHVIVPECSADTISNGLRELTKALVLAGKAKASHGILGGEWGYGALFENDTFAFHPYCWCEREDCPWCKQCDCGETTCRVCSGVFGNAPNFWHKPSGTKLRWYKWIGRSMEGEVKGQWRDILRSCLESLQ